MTIEKTQEAGTGQAMQKGRKIIFFTPKPKSKTYSNDLPISFLKLASVLDLEKYDIKIKTNLDDLENFISKKNVSTIIVNNKWYSKLFKDLYKLIPKGLNFYHIAYLWEEYKQAIPVYATNELWFLENLSGLSKGLYEKESWLSNIW